MQHKITSYWQHPKHGPGCHPLGGGRSTSYFAARAIERGDRRDVTTEARGDLSLEVEYLHGHQQASYQTEWRVDIDGGLCL